MALEMDLDECMRRALANDKGLKKAELDVEIAKQAGISTRASYWPSMRLSSGYTRRLSERYIYDPIAQKNRYINVEDDAYNLGVSASQTIFRGGRNISSDLQSRRDLSKVRYNMRRERQNVLFGAEEAYLKVLEYEQQLMVRQDGFELALSTKRLAELNFKSGLETKSNLELNRVETREAELYLAQAESDLELARDQLRVVIDVPDGEELKLAGATDYREIWPEEKWCLAMALENRPDWLSAQADRDKTRYSFLSQLSSWLPSVTADGSYRYWADELPFEKPNWSVGVSASYSFFSGWSRAAGTRTAELRYRRSKLNVEELRDNITIEVRTNLATLENLQKRVKLDREMGEVRHKQMVVTQLSYKSGRTSSGSLLRARQRTTDQELKYWRAVFNVRRAQARLARSLGLETPELMKQY